jgi:hypothetical protein
MRYFFEAVNCFPLALEDKKRYAGREETEKGATS